MRETHGPRKSYRTVRLTKSSPDGGKINWNIGVTARQDVAVESQPSHSRQVWIIIRDN